MKIGGDGGCSCVPCPMGGNGQEGYKGVIYYHPGEFPIPCTEEQFVASGGTIFYYQTEKREE